MFALWATLLISCVFLKNVLSKEKCESGWIPHSGYSYKRFCNANFDEAQRRCTAEKSRLASIHSEDENKFIRKLIGSPKKYHKDVYKSYNSYAWIGARRFNGIWKWIDGTEWNFTKWSAGEPNNKWEEEDCAQMFTRDLTGYTDGEGDGYWNDVSCDRKMHFFVCQRRRKL